MVKVVLLLLLAVAGVVSAVCVLRAKSLRMEERGGEDGEYNNIVHGTDMEELEGGGEENREFDTIQEIEMSSRTEERGEEERNNLNIQET